MSNSIKPFYQIVGRDYDQHMIKTGHYLAQRRNLKKLQSLIDEPILDLACGPGYLISLLANNHNQIYANDFSKKMILLAKSKLGQKAKKIHFTTDDAEKLKHYDKKFNTILCCNLFYYIGNKDKALKRWGQLLKKSGKLVLFEECPFKISNDGALYQHVKELKPLLHPISTEQTIKIVEKNGFKLYQKKKTAIDKDHSLYGLVFVLQS